ncbi:hypothetical protein SBA3_710031 [Candidatus Sulfopaludibacter sp. SbA3]|nr:hypothetical protein SBA3_710031 [Candidatus Sulfopaludibacter sp. SbA3]
MGWASVGTDHDTLAFAVETIRRWWNMMGRETHPGARQLLITADSGGSSGSRVRLWKVELQKLADETRLEISVCHFPPGTSKWNKIEHRLYSFITKNWRGRPLVSHEVIVNLIAPSPPEPAFACKASWIPANIRKGSRWASRSLLASTCTGICSTVNGTTPSRLVPNATVIFFTYPNQIFTPKHMR